ncbi:MAG TPA: hypothetical protein VFW29_12555 [Solirubrobacteraceae bacterium]|nr:hypothetical protein [Solirubrobacteraceae bacterium]
MSISSRSGVAGGLIASLLAAGAIAAGCGSSSSSGSSTSAGGIGPVAEAADVTARESGAKVALSGTVRSSSLGVSLTISGTGAFNFAGHEGTFALSLGGLPTTAQQALHASSLNMTEVFKDGSAYVSSPLFAGKLPHGAKFVKINLSQVGKTLGLNPSSLTGGGADPTQYLTELRSAGANPKVVGHDTIRGVATTRYAATVDLQKALEAQGSSSAQAKAALEKISAAVGGSLPVEAWIDDKGLLRKVSVKLNENASGQTIAAVVNAEYFDFGTTPAVTAPASSEAYDVTGQVGGSLSGSGL